VTTFSGGRWAPSRPALRSKWHIVITITMLLTAPATRLRRCRAKALLPRRGSGAAVSGLLKAAFLNRERCRRGLRHCQEANGHSCARSADCGAMHANWCFRPTLCADPAVCQIQAGQFNCARAAMAWVASVGPLSLQLGHRGCGAAARVGKACLPAIHHCAELALAVLKRREARQRAPIQVLRTAGVP
jgi:hypothetical protein